MCPTFNVKCSSYSFFLANIHHNCPFYSDLNQAQDELFASICLRIQPQIMDEMANKVNLGLGLNLFANFWYTDQYNDRFYLYIVNI